MNQHGADTDWGSRARLLSRLAIVAALVSCSLNCVVNQLVARGAASLGLFSPAVSWASFAIVLAGVGLGLAGIIGGWRNKSLDTVAIATIGLVLNLGIVFVIVWHFAVIRPAVLGQ